MVAVANKFIEKQFLGIIINNTQFYANLFMRSVASLLDDCWLGLALLGQGQQSESRHRKQITNICLRRIIINDTLSSE